MNREIKFRAWDTDDLEMRNDVALTEEGYADAPWGKEKPHWVLMQFTGLADVNGTPIYEGDKVAHNNGDIYTVQWNQLHCGWGLFLDGGMWMELDADWVTNTGEAPQRWENASLKVVGHIYER